MTNGALKTVLLAAAILAGNGDPGSALEFAAERVAKIDGHTRRSYVFYRDGMWRVETNDIGSVDATIVRKDKGVMWLLQSGRRQFMTRRYDPAEEILVSERSAGEVLREVIAADTLFGHPATVYRLSVREPDGSIQVYYQWLATDLHVPLRVIRKNSDWLVEYPRLRVTHHDDFLFDVPRSYQAALPVAGR